MAAARWRRDGGVADPESLLTVSGLDCRDTLSLAGGAGSVSLIPSFSALTRSTTPSSSSSDGASNWTRVGSGTNRAVHDLGKLSRLEMDSQRASKSWELRI